MTITLPKQLETAIGDQAKRRGVSPETLVLEAISDRYLPMTATVEPRDEWERKLFKAVSDCGVSLSNEALSSEGLYD